MYFILNYYLITWYRIQVMVDDFVDLRTVQIWLFK